MSLAGRLQALIAHEGPLTIAQLMSVCLHDPQHGYYAARPGLGRDFVTAPEISQTFGELIGLWCAQSWLDLGAPATVRWVELGPGRGALMADAWRAARVAPGFLNAADLWLVDASAPLRRLQEAALAGLGARAQWAEDLGGVPDGPLLLVGNEFLDCLPVRQFVRAQGGWRERLVGLEAGALAFGLGPAIPEGVAETVVPAPLRAAPEGAVVEHRPALPALTFQLAERLQRASGRALFIDYGAAHPTTGDTLQAIRAGAKVDPLAFPGESDLTAHVDFAALKGLAEGAGLDVAGPLAQGAWLGALGIEARAAALAKARPDCAQQIRLDVARLTDPQAMGTLFQVVCLSAPGLPPPAGFA